MSENWTREQMVEVYGEAGADAMRKLSDAYAEIERLQGLLQALSRRPSAVQLVRTGVGVGTSENNIVWADVPPVVPEAAHKNLMRELDTIAEQARRYSDECDEMSDCLEFLLQEAINGVICEPDKPDTCERCAAIWARTRAVLGD